MYWAPGAKALAIHFCHSHWDCDEMPGSSDQCATTACTLLSRGSCDDKKKLYILNFQSKIVYNSNLEKISFNKNYKYYKSQNININTIYKEENKLFYLYLYFNKI